MSEQGDYWRSLPKAERKRIAKDRWPNWYINRGRLSLNPSRKELRSMSWRKVF